MKRLTVSSPNQGASRRAAQNRNPFSFALENLELRRLLSTTFDLARTVYDSAPVTSGHFGDKIVTHGNLALVAAADKTVNGIDLAGQVSLVDTTTGQVERVFDNPSGGSALLFGSGMAWIGDKIAISAPEGADGGTGIVWIYANASDTTPVEIDNAVPGTFFGTGLAAIGNDLLISQTASPDNVGRIYRYDTSGGLLNTYFNPENANDINFGQNIVVDGNTIYAAAQVTIGAETQPAIIGLDGTTGNETASFPEPAAYHQSWHYAYGTSFAVSPVSHDLFVGTFGFTVTPQFDIFDGVYQFHSNGSFVHLYQDPRVVGEGFMTVTVTDTNQLVVGASQSVAINPNPDSDPADKRCPPNCATPPNPLLKPVMSDC